MKIYFIKIMVVILFVFVAQVINAQTLSGNVKLQSDSTTNVKNAHVALWSMYETNPDTLFLTTDSLGNYSFTPFKIEADPDTVVTNIEQIVEDEKIIVTNNPGQGHKFILPSDTKPRLGGEIYSIDGKLIAKPEPKFENRKLVYSWDGSSKSGTAKNGVYIFSQVFDDGSRKTTKFIQLNDGSQPSTIDVNNNFKQREKSSPVTEKSLQSLDQATYIFWLRSDSSTSPNFVEKMDTVVFSPITGVSNFYAQHYVEGVPQHRDVRLRVVDVYDTTGIENVLVKMIDPNTNSTIDSAFTDSNGIATINNIPLGTVFKWAYGNDTTINNRPDYFSRTDSGLDSIVGTNLSFNDTIDPLVRKRVLPRKWLVVPKRPGDNVSPDSVNFTGHVDWLTEVITDSVNIEAAEGRPINIYVDPQSYESYFDDDYVNYGDSLFFPADSLEPWNYVSTQPNITPSMESNYDEETNFYPGQLGVFVNLYASNQVYLNQKEGQLNDGKTGILGFDLDVEAGVNTGHLFQMNFYCKQFGLKYDGIPSNRSGLYNGTSDANSEDRAIFWTIYKHKQEIYKDKTDNEDFRNTTENL